MPKKTDISIIFSTYNRSTYLYQTLKLMSELNTDGLNTVFIVVNNNSNDNTDQIIHSFKDKLPLIHLSESRPGKNCALNHALNTIELGDIVVFTDDDILPPKNWLQDIYSACTKYQQYNVFGGKVNLEWPLGVEIPNWAQNNDFIKSVVFSQHNMGEQVLEYHDTYHPTGANFWVRKEVFTGGRRYDETIGPTSKNNFKMGSEATLLKQLEKDGYKILYIPDVYVGHHVQEKLLSETEVRYRAKRNASGLVQIHGILGNVYYNEHPLLWKFRRIISITKFFLLNKIASLLPNKEKRLHYFLKSMSFYIWHLDSLKEVLKKESKQHGSTNSSTL